MRLEASLLSVDPSQLEWVIGGMNKAELVSAVTGTTQVFITPDEGGADLLVH
jgi:hypothetical protein